MIEERPTIPSEPDDWEERAGEPDFETLRRMGIELAQTLSCENWTDFNLHDPGVTLLEQICYGITDLIHRNGFDIADHLSSPDGELDFERLGLEMPERIFPARPTTVSDYRQAIIDAVAEVDDVLFEPLPEAGSTPVRADGLYRILIRPRPGTGGTEKARIRNRVANIYASLRNLCEDAQEIGFVEELAFELCGEVEVERDRAPEEILAGIYHRCAEQVASRVRIHPFEHARRSDLGLEQLFTGPARQHGFCDKEDLRQVQSGHSVADMFALIGEVEGVDHVRDLYFRRDGQVERERINAGGPERALRLSVPMLADQLGIRLTSQGRRLYPSFESFRRELEVLELRARGAGRAIQDPAKLYAKPRGEFRNLRQYTSIQHHLPAIFGLRESASQASLTATERARAGQLKGYLLLFDQLMANYTAQLAGLRDLYARDVGAPRSYASQAVDEDGRLGLTQIYPERPDEALASVVASHDHFTERKGRQLDYLLALYGEHFSQNSLRAFDLYADPGEKDRRVLENKAAFLREIVQLTRDRGAAFDYLAADQASVSGLQQRVSHLLGFTDHRRKSLTAAFREHGLVPVPDDRSVTPSEERQSRLCSSEQLLPSPNPWEAGIPLIPDEAAASERGAESLSGLIDDLVHLLPLSNGELGQGVLRTGVSLGNYRLGTAGEDAGWQSYLRLPGEDDWWRLAMFQDRAEAIRDINRLRRLMVLLNTGSEGMHVVEHILLRPRSDAAAERLDTPADEDFFSFRLSVVFPAWTARFQDERFRQFARETVRINCPAHVVPEILWLDYEDMLAFEQLQEEWLDALGRNSGSEEEQDAAVEGMLGFLLARRGEACWALEPVVEAGQESGGTSYV